MPIRLGDIIVIAGYLVLITVIGLYWAKRNKSTDEYFLGNRSFSGWVIGLSMIGTSISSISFLAFPGDTYKTAWLRIIPNIGIIAGSFAAAYLFIPFFRGSRVTTAYEFIEGRWGTSVRLYGAASFLPGQLLRLCTILYLLAELVHTLTGISMEYSVIGAGVFVSFYTIAGGIEAVVWTDVIQTLVLIFGGVVIMATILRDIPGGLLEVLRVAIRDGKLSFSELMPNGTLRPASWRFTFSEKTATMMLLTGILGWVDGYSANQNVVQRYCAAKSPKEARKAVWITCWTSLPIWAYFAFIGTSLYVFFQLFPAQHALDILTGANGAKAEEILPFFIVHYLPVGLSGLVISAALAAAMSSLDSSINAISTVSIVDIYRPYLVKGRDDAHYLKVARWIAIVASVIMIAGALVLAATPTKTLQDTLMVVGSFLGGGIMVIFLFGLFSEIGDARGFFAGLVVLYLYKAWVLLCNFGVFPAAWRPPVDNYFVGITGEVLCALGLIIVTLILPKRERDLTGYTLWTSPWVRRRKNQSEA